MTTLLDLVRTAVDDSGPLAVADASLWVDGTKIYEARGLAMRIVRDSASSIADSGADSGAGEELLDPLVDTWLRDHRPTWTVPALPLMAMVDRLARAAASLCARDARRGRGGRPRPALGPRRRPAAPHDRGCPAGGGALRRDAARLARSGEPAPSRVSNPWPPVGCCSLRNTQLPLLIQIAKSFRQPSQRTSGAKGWRMRPGIRHRTPFQRRTPTSTGTLFHGPSFQLLRSLALAPGASSALLDAAAGGARRGLLHEALLDALTHGIPHDRLCDWSPEIRRRPRRLSAPPRLAAVVCAASRRRRGALRDALRRV